MLQLYKTGVILFSSELEDKILKILNSPSPHETNEMRPEAIRTMESILLLHRAQYGQKSLATKFSKPINSSFYHEKSELHVFNKFGLRKVPLRAQRALVMWSVGEYPIRLLHHIPTPWQILEMQARGQRCVSLDNTSGCLQRKYEGKNYFDFIIHDLLHADHFFNRYENRMGQIGFARFIIELHDQFHLSFLKEKSFQEQFQKEFDYLISDMNSHPLHLVLTLKSILDRFFQNPTTSDLWLHQAFHEAPELAKTLIAKDRSRSAEALQHLFAHKASKNFSLNF